MYSLARGRRWTDTAGGSLPKCRSKVLPLIGGLEDLKAAHERLIDGHHRARVVKLAAVIRRTKQGHELASLEEFIAILHDLMSSTNQVDVVLLVELAHNVLSEGKTDTTIIISVVLNATLWVGPQQIAEKSRVWHISRSHNILDLVQVFELGTQTAVHAEDLLVDQSSHGKAIKDVTEHAPESDRVAALALIVETIDAIDLGALVIAS